MTATWHVDDASIERYAAGAANDAVAASIEAHLVNCGECRAAIAHRADHDRLEAIWTETVDTLDVPRPRVAERLLRRLGVQPHTARLLVATRSLRLSWLVSIGFALAFGVTAASHGEHTMVPFLMLAPLLPVAGVAVAYGPSVDPTYEVTLATPLSNSRLLLTRSAAVLATTLVLGGVAALTLPSLDWTAAAWILPSLGLTAASLAAGTLTSPTRAAGAVTAVWLAAVFATGRELDDRLAAFHSAGQVVYVAILALSVIVVLRRRDALEIRSEL